MKKNILIKIGCFAVVGSVLATLVYAQTPPAIHDTTINNSAALIRDGRHIFRHDTYGDEAFWGDALQLHQAIQGSQFGGVGPGVSPKTALALGLKVDSDALPPQILAKLRQGANNRRKEQDPDAAVCELERVVKEHGFRSVELGCRITGQLVSDSLGQTGMRCRGHAENDRNRNSLRSGECFVKDSLSVCLELGDLIVVLG